MSSAIDLVILNGPSEGEVISLTPDTPLKLGRSAKGYQLIDPLVSLNHAMISFEGDSYWIEDFRSATGTYINGERVGERTECLVPGQHLKIGETEFEVVERQQSRLMQVGGIAGLVVIFVTAILGGQQLLRQIEVSYEPYIEWYQPVRQGGGRVDAVVPIAMSFIRRHGVDHRALRILEVTDYDRNGVDELWLDWDGHRELVTFDGRGDWDVLSAIPDGCTESSTRLAASLPAECYADQTQVKTELPAICKQADISSQGFPELDCDGALYRYDDGVGYHPIRVEGVVAWMPQTEEIPDPSDKKGELKIRQPKDGPPLPYRFTLTEQARLAGFLADRGVEEPIHYLVCEEALKGLVAQVLTYSGEIKRLDYGCINEFELSGQTRRDEFLTLKPVAFAFTGVGYEALIADFATHYTGSADGLFGNRKRREVIAALSSPPERRVGAIRLAFAGPESSFSPIAQELRLPGVRRLARGEFADDPPPLVHSEVVMRDVSRFDPPGCAELVVQVLDGWHCALPACQTSQPFVRVRNAGCGGSNKIARLPFAGGAARYVDDHVTAHIELDTVEEFGQTDVLRARIGWQLSK
ncbi:MAG: FHA domain-containing protein [Myxococcota bacterium]